MKRFISAYLLLFFTLCSLAQVTLGFKGESSASVGIYVKDLRSGEIIASNDAHKALLPASVMKAVTAASAYSTMSHDFTFDTNIYLTGAISNGICSGNLVIVSCGDPTIDSENFDDRPTLCSEIYNALKSKGISQIKGKVIINQSLSDSGCIPQWEIDDVAWSYGAGLYGFNYRDNYFKLWPATKKSEPYVPGLNVTVRTARSTDLIRGVNSNNLTVEGIKPHDKSWMVNTTMNNPAEVFIYELTKYLNTKGIKIGDKVTEANDRKLLYTHHSPKLPDILSEMLITSHNLFAEGMLRQLNPGSSRKAAIEHEMKIWSNRIPSTAYNKILDGSGLSRADRVQPVFIGDILEWMAKSEFCDGFVSLFPKVGVNGTVKSMLKDTDLAGLLALKSGSMNAVQCFAGYKLDEKDKPTHVVVILINAFYCDRSSVRKSIERFLLDTFNE